MPLDSLQTGREAEDIVYSLDRKLAALGPRQQEIAGIVYAHASVTPREVQQRLSEQRSLRVIRTLLDRLVLKGLVRRKASGRHREILYIAAIPTPRVREAAIRKLVDERFGGSMALASTALQEAARVESQVGLPRPKTAAAIRRFASDPSRPSWARRAA
jgi:predicted transcriptional regulator